MADYFRSVPDPDRGFGLAAAALWGTGKHPGRRLSAWAVPLAARSGQGAWCASQTRCRSDALVPDGVIAL